MLKATGNFFNKVWFSDEKTVGELVFPIINKREDGYLKTIITDRLAILSQWAYWYIDLKY